MSRFLLVLVLAMIASIPIGCQTTPKNENTVSEEPSYEYDEARMKRIDKMCEQTMRMLEDPSVPVNGLVAQLSQTADTLERVVRHCSDPGFNIWVRGYLRYITGSIMRGERLTDLLEEGGMDKIIKLPYLWTVTQKDSLVGAYTYMFRNSEEMYDRFASIFLISDNRQRKCLFDITNLSDTIIKDLTIGFVDTTGKEITLRPTDAEVDGYMDFKDGTVKIIFTWDKIWPLLTGSEVMSVTYNAKDEKVVMVQPLLEIESVKSLFEAPR